MQWLVCVGSINNNEDDDRKEVISLLPFTGQSESGHEYPVHKLRRLHEEVTIPISMVDVMIPNDPKISKVE